jgi:hypothetical protein
MNNDLIRRYSRRDAIKWMLTAAGGVLLADGTPLSAAISTSSPNPKGTGYGTDPDLVRSYKPGELWPLTLNQEQRQTAAALCDTIIPADEFSPAASAVGVTEFIDEWVSAPYPKQREDRKEILAGLAWIDAESNRRYQLSFARASESQRIELCTDIAHAPAAKPEFKEAAGFFKRYRDLTAGGFYTTPEGTKDIGYVGNTPQINFAGPPADLIKKMGLEDA